MTWDPDEGIAEDGTIRTGVALERIPDAFRPCVRRAAERLAHAAASPSVYLYGSVATGRAVHGASDVDLVAVGVDADAARTFSDELSREFAEVCRGVEIGVADRSAYAGDTPRAYGDRAFLRHYCVRLDGPDLAASWPAFPADARAARGFNGDIGAQAAAWRRALPAADRSGLARRAARKTLFAVAGLVSVHDRVWTTDRASAASRWGEVRVDLAPQLEQLAEWSAGDPSGEGLAEALGPGGVVDRVVVDFDARIGLW